MQEGLYNFYSLPNWYCNLALLGFDNLEKQLNHRRGIAKIYAENLNKKILNPNIVEKISISSNLRFPIFVEDRKKSFPCQRELIPDFFQTLLWFFWRPRLFWQILCLVEILLFLERFF